MGEMLGRYIRGLKGQATPKNVPQKRLYRSSIVKGVLTHIGSHDLSFLRTQHAISLKNKQLKREWAPITLSKFGVWLKRMKDL